MTLDHLIVNGNEPFRAPFDWSVVPAGSSGIFCNPNGSLSNATAACSNLSFFNCSSCAFTNGASMNSLGVSIIAAGDPRPTIQTNPPAAGGQNLAPNGGGLMFMNNLVAYTGYMSQGLSGTYPKANGLMPSGDNKPKWGDGIQLHGGDYDYLGYNYFLDVTDGAISVNGATRNTTITHNVIVSRTQPGTAGIFIGACDMYQGAESINNEVWGGPNLSLRYQTADFTGTAIDSNTIDGCLGGKCGGQSWNDADGSTISMSANSMLDVAAIMVGSGNWSGLRNNPLDPSPTGDSEARAESDTNPDHPYYFPLGRLASLDPLKPVKITGNTVLNSSRGIQISGIHPLSPNLSISGNTVENTPTGFFKNLHTNGVNTSLPGAMERLTCAYSIYTGASVYLNDGRVTLSGNAWDTPACGYGFDNLLSDFSGVGTGDPSASPVLQFGLGLPSNGTF